MRRPLKRMIREAARIQRFLTSAHDVVVAGVAERRPKRGGVGLVVSDQRGDTYRAFVAKPLVSRVHEPTSDAAATVLRQHCEADVAPPTVPGGDESADNSVLMLGHQQSITGVLDETCDAGVVVRSARSLTARNLPQSENASNILRLRDSDSHLGIT